MRKQRKLWQAFLVASIAAVTLPAFVQAGVSGAGEARVGDSSSTTIDRSAESLATQSAYSTLGRASTTTATNGGPRFTSDNWQRVEVTPVPSSAYAAIGRAGTTTATNGGPRFLGLPQEEPERLASQGVPFLPNSLH